MAGDSKPIIVNNPEEVDGKRPRESVEKEKDEARQSSDDAPPLRKRARREAKCSKCKTRLARGACSQSACIACCSDLQCEGHREARENAQWKEAVLKGTTDVQKRAKAKRASAILPGTFREPGFLFMNQTITIWDREQFMANKKWREDAIRRADKRKARNINHSSKPIRNSVNRFRLVMEDLYRNSLKQNKVNVAVEEAKSAIETIGKRETREHTPTSITEQGPEETDSGKRTSPGCKLS